MTDYERAYELDLNDEGYFSTIIPEWYGKEEETVIVEESPLPEMPEHVLAREEYVDDEVTDEYVAERIVCPCQQECGFSGACAEVYDDFMDDYVSYDVDEYDHYSFDWDRIEEFLRNGFDILDDAYDWARSMECGWFYPD